MAALVTALAVLGARSFKGCAEAIGYCRVREDLAPGIRALGVGVLQHERRLDGRAHAARVRSRCGGPGSRSGHTSRERCRPRCSGEHSEPC